MATSIHEGKSHVNVNIVKQPSQANKTSKPTYHQFMEKRSYQNTETPFSEDSVHDRKKNF